MNVGRYHFLFPNGSDLSYVFSSFYLDGELGDVASEDGGLTLVPRGIRISLTFRNHFALFDLVRT